MRRSNVLSLPLQLVFPATGIVLKLYCGHVKQRILHVLSDLAH
jgi:hypothetical protein